MAQRDVRPVKLAHFVVRTSRYREMVDWYVDLLQARIAFGDENATFMTYDDEHHRVAVIKMPGLLPKTRAMAAVDHVAFTYADLDDLLATFERLSSKGIRPVWPINHGATTSLYYEDPDSNFVELQVDNFASPEETDVFLGDGRFAINPVGIDFDPDEMLARRKAGASIEELTRWPDEVSPRQGPPPARYLGAWHSTLMKMAGRWPRG